jgi:hypothetical protein
MLFSSWRLGLRLLAAADISIIISGENRIYLALDGRTCIGRRGSKDRAALSEDAQSIREPVPSSTVAARSAGVEGPKKSTKDGFAMREEGDGERHTPR